MDFKQRIKPFLQSDDLIISDFVTQTLHDNPAIDEEWVKQLLDMAAQNEEKANFILTFLRIHPAHEEAAHMLVEAMKQAPASTQHLFGQLLYDFVPEVALKHREDISMYLPNTDWELYGRLASGSEQEIKEEYDRILNKLEAEANFNPVLYRQAKKIAYTLVKNGWVTKAEVEHSLEENLNQEWFDYRGILAVYLIGLMNLDTYIHKLAPLLVKDEDILLEEIAAAFISFQTDEVVEAVSPYLLKEESNIFAASIIENIKTDYAVEALRNAYHQAKDEDSRAIIFEALIHQLSPAAEPEINDYVSKGSDSLFVDVEQLAYSYYKIMGIDHPLLDEWTDLLQNRGNEEREGEVSSHQPIRVEKIGRNDPCPCGSGKKYKKCCG